MNPTKTPEFDALLDVLLAELKPHTRVCVQKDISKYCEREFTIEDVDIEFYKMLRVPPPKRCPTCRRQQRFAFVNRSSFYKRKNEAPEGPEMVISYVPPVSLLTIYDYDYYRSDKWDPLSYGVDFDLSKGLFEQMYDLRLRVPQPALLRDPSNINYEYSLNGRNSKNVYCSSGIFDSENVWYSVFLTKCRDVMDSNKVPHCDNCYKAFFSNNSSSCQNIYFSKDCINSRFMYDCRNCQDCFGCVNLRNKRYCFFNTQLSKEEYEEKVRELQIDRRSSIVYITDKFWELVKSQPVLASRSVQTVNSKGALLVNCNNCTECVSVEKSEHIRYGDSVISHRDSMDIYASGGSELMYDCSGSGSDCANVRFLVTSKFITHSDYMINCRHCQFCFGCVGLENKKYCIFNKQYEPEEYFKKLDGIKTTMLKNGEYGEFFPYEFCTYAYNGSDVDDTFPLTVEEIQKLGAQYQEYIEIDMTGLDIISIEELPDSIHDVTDDILSKAIICEETGKPFRIIKTELEFYRKNNIPLPTIHPYKRTKNMFKHMGNHHSYKGICESCGISLETIYKKEDGWRLYCESCFQEEII